MSISTILFPIIGSTTFILLNIYRNSLPPQATQEVLIKYAITLSPSFTVANFDFLLFFSQMETSSYTFLNQAVSISCSFVYANKQQYPITPFFHTSNLKWFVVLLSTPIPYSWHILLSTFLDGPCFQTDIKASGNWNKVSSIYIYNNYLMKKDFKDNVPFSSW